MGAIALTACGGDVPPPDLISIFGRLFEPVTQDGNDVLVTVAGAEVYVASTGGSILSATNATNGSAIVTDAGGAFTVSGLEKEKEIALVFSSPGRVRTVFRGETESNHMILFSGSVFQVGLERQQAVVDEFTTAAAATSALMTFNYDTAGNGAMVRGRVLRAVENPPGYEPGLYFFNVEDAAVTIMDGAGNPYRVFYRGDFPNDTDPGPIEPSRTTTGEDARFAAFAVQATGLSTFTFPAGRVTVTVTADGTTTTETSLVVEDGLTVLDLLVVP
jgi:hypothetical protein